jgi:hypothetical protein
MPVRIFALALVVAEVMPGGEIRLRCDFIHKCLLDSVGDVPLASILICGGFWQLGQAERILIQGRMPKNSALRRGEFTCGLRRLQGKRPNKTLTRRNR